MRPPKPTGRTGRTGLVVGMLVTVGCFARSDVERMLQQPISADEHSLIARRYRERAAEARRIAAAHEVMAGLYRDGDGAPGDVRLRDEMVAHCEAIARDYQDAAARYDALAANHTSRAATWRYAPGGGGPQDRAP